MATTGTAEKICIHCKQDCGAKPRSKDAQGRYTCQSCLEGLKARAAAASAKPMRTAKVIPPAAPPDEEDQSVLASLLGDSPDPCPSCAAPLKQGTVLCNFCGFNKETGQALKTRVMRAPKEKKAKAPGQPGQGFTLEPMHVGLIALGIEAALFAGCFVSPAMVIPLYGVTALCGLIGLVLLFYYTLSDGHGWWLVGSIFIPFVVLLYVFGVSERGHLKAMLLANIAGGLMVMAAVAGIVANGQEGEIGLPKMRAQSAASEAP